MPDKDPDPDEAEDPPPKIPVLVTGTSSSRLPSKTPAQETTNATAPMTSAGLSTAVWSTPNETPTRKNRSEVIDL